MVTPWRSASSASTLSKVARCTWKVEPKLLVKVSRKSKSV